MRCRLVARGFKKHGERDRADLFVAMPPLEAKKLLLRQVARQRRSCRNGRWEKVKIILVDVKKAHLYGVVEGDKKVYIELTEELKKKGKCGRLRRWLYGMRGAGQAW